MSQVSMIAVSVVVPVYSGSKYLPDLVNELEKLRDRWANEQAPMRIVETILVDDAAIDDSPALIDRLARENSWVTAIHLVRNFGQHAATIAGILHTSGDWVVTLDEDLQHPPGRIEDLLRHAVRTGSDVVYANAETAVHEKFVRDLGSRLYKRTIVTLSGNRNVRLFNSFRLIRGSIARAASSVCGHDTYFDVSLSWFTQRVEFIWMKLKDVRFIQSGTSGYRFSKLLSHARRMLMSSQVKIMRVCGLFGLIVVAGSVVGGIALFLQKLIAPETIDVGGWTSLALISIFFGGIITFLVGVVLEYLSALVLAAHGKPLFFVIDRSSDVILVDYFDLKSL
jgi:glycosyltransferase involved in cell wall biosynthesis